MTLPLVTFCWGVTVPLTLAQVPHLIRYQGRATDAQGAPLEGSHNLTFRLYDKETEGNRVWEEVQPNIPLTNGHFSVLLGQVTSLNVDWNKPLWLAVQVGETPELAPRQLTTSVPFALVAEQLDGPLRIAGGNVGIGVIPTAWFPNGKVLQIGAGGALQGHTSDERVSLLSNAYEATDGPWKYLLSDKATTQLVLDNGEFIIQTAPSGTADSPITWTQRVTVDNSGKVGIGTTEPQEKLHLHQGNILLTNAQFLKGMAGATGFNLIGVDSSGFVQLGPAAGGLSGIRVFPSGGAGSGPHHPRRQRRHRDGESYE